MDKFIIALSPMSSHPLSINLNYSIKFLLLLHKCQHHEEDHLLEAVEEVDHKIETEVVEAEAAEAAEELDVEDQALFLIFHLTN